MNQSFNAKKKRRFSSGKRKSYQKRQDEMLRIAASRVIALMHLAEENFASDRELAQRYVEIARNIAMGTKIHLPAQYRGRICHKCHHLLVPGENLRIRFIRRKNYGSYRVVTCLDCGHITRYLFKGKACRKYPLPQRVSENS